MLECQLKKITPPTSRDFGATRPSLPKKLRRDTSVFEMERVPDLARKTTERANPPERPARGHAIGRQMDRSRPVRLFRRGTVHRALPVPSLPRGAFFVFFVVILFSPRLCGSIILIRPPKADPPFPNPP